jgi:hypothetical protein
MDQWAKLGASVRLRESRGDLAAIYKAYPDLKRQQGLAPIATSTPRRKRGRFSVKGRRAISEGMRKYWARRKAKAAKTAKSAGEH